MKLEMHAVDTIFLYSSSCYPPRSMACSARPSSLAEEVYHDTNHLLIRISLWLIECHFVKYFFDILVINSLCF